MEQTQTPKKISGKKLFYIIYGSVMGLLLVAVLIAMIPLRNFLVRFQASRPEEKSKEIYETYFANPDWATLYEKAGIQDTEFEGVDEFVAFMEEKTAGKTLGFMETAAGLSDDHKYVVRADNEKLATFKLVNTVTDPEELPNWTLGQIELAFERPYAVTVEKDPAHTVLVNGKALDGSYTVMKETTSAEEYLPLGVHGYRKDTQYAGTFLFEPTVTCTDENGVDVPLTLGDDGVYRAEQPQQEEMTEEQKKLAVNAAKVYAAYSVQRAGSYELRKYYDPESQLYKDIISIDLFTRDFNSYFFDEKNMVVTDYYRYSDTLYSIRVDLTFKVNLTTGNVKDFPSNRTYFFETKEDGKVLVVAATNASVHDVKRQVRLDFTYDGKTESVFVDADTKTVALPAVQAPAGQVLAGWARKSVNAAGKTFMTMILTPGAGGFGVPSEELTPMELVPVFEEEGV